MRAVLVHCAAGKDRTGILAALTHHVAGVHPDDITADYLLTNDPERLARRLPQVKDAIHEISGRVPDDAAVLVAEITPSLVMVLSVPDASLTA